MSLFNRLDLTGVGFARLDEYFGLWAMESARFRMAWDRAGQMDLKAHVEQNPPVTASIKTAAVSVTAAANTPDTFGRQSQSIALIYASGVLMKQVPSGEAGTSTILLRRVIREAANDDSIAGIVLVIDSPGGTVSGTSDLAADIAQANAIKPVWAFIEDLGASAAYWCASACDRIIANHRTASAGSIGTVLCLYDFSGHAEKNGIEAVVISTGELKGAGFPGAPITDNHRAYFQRLIDQTQTSFAQAVQDGRGLSAEAVAELATGEVWLADQALELGLIDAIQSLDQTIDEMREHLANDNTNTGGGTTAASQHLENQTMSKTRTDKLAARRNDTPVQPTGKASTDEDEKKPVGKVEDGPADDDTKPKSEDGTADDECDCVGEEGCDCDKQDEPVEPAAEEDDKPKASSGKPAAKVAAPAAGGGGNARATEGQKFIAAFGPMGATYYAEGKSFDEARDLHTEALAKENAELKAKLEGLDLGASQPLKLSGEGDKPNVNAKLAANIGGGLARFAGGIKLPSQKQK